MNSPKFLGEGCKTCPVKNCDTTVYRGSRCAFLRDSAGVYRDPTTNLEALKKVIAGMTAQQMAEFIVEYRWTCDDCPEYDLMFKYKCSMNCKGRCEEWLNLPEDPGVEVSS